LVGKLKGRDYSEDLGVEDNIRMDLRETGWVWTVFIWLRIWTSGGLL
jgi:hypothetical protein